MTISDYHIVMRTVNIATLKAKLSYYLGQVRGGGEFLVLDRKTPVARIIPSGGADQGLVIRKAPKSPSAIGKIRIPPLGRKIDSTRMLREDRNRR